MLNETSVMKRNRQQSIAMSDAMIKEIRTITRDYVSLSSFVRMSVLNEIERRRKWEKNL